MILVAVAVLWRRIRPADPPFGRQLGWGALAILCQGATLLLVHLLLEWLESDGASVTDRLPLAAWAIWGIQLVRAALLLLAASMWFRVVKPRLVRSWRGVVLTIALLIIVLLPEVPVIGSILVIVVMLRLKWTAHIHGWRRSAGLLACFALLALMSANIGVSGIDGENVAVSGGLGDEPAVNILGSDLPGPAAAVARITGPWDTVIRVASHLLRLQLLIACLQLLVFPIHLRGLSLKRRFTVTMILYRVIPGVLGFVVLVLGVYFGLGLHKTRLAQEAFNETLNQNLRAAGIVLEAESDWPARADSSAVMDAFLDAARWTPRAFFVLKHVRLRAPEADSTHAAAARVDGVLRTASTPGTPRKFLTGDFYGAGAVDTVLGMTAADTVLCLGAARARRSGDTAVVAEVYVPVDSLYLSGIAALVKTKVRLRVNPGVLIGRSQVSVGAGDSSHSDSTFTVTAEPTSAPGETGFWYKQRFLAKAFIPLSNWREDLAGGVTGAAELTLSVAPMHLVRGIVSNSLVFASNAVAVLIFAFILVMFLLAEYSAARTGRSIIRGILDDVKGLAEAARRFGAGELAHRVDVRGKDELGSLSASFNTMAENIEQNQELLLEKERLQADLELARDIQQRLLPQSAPIMPGLDAAGISIPSREVGGDLFYFLPVPEGRLGLTIGDVSGKSVPAALLMSNVLAALKTEARLVDDEHEILTHLNRLIAEQVEPGRFVTFFYGVVDRQKCRLSYACAGHNPPLKMSREGASQWLTEAGVPLGVLPENTYSPAESPLEIGDVLVLYSDGVTEAERPKPFLPARAAAKADDDDEQNEEEPEFFDEQRLEETVRDARHGSAAEVLEAIVDAVRDFTGGADLSDDMTIVVVKITEDSTS